MSQVGLTGAGAIDAQGRLLLLIEPPFAPLSLVRLAGNGTVDRSFGTNGRVDLSFAGSRVARVAIGPDGRIVVGLGIGWPSRRVSFLPDGRPDPTFTEPATLGPWIALEIDRQGRILLGGTEHSEDGYRENILLQRLLPTGVRDGAFGDGGAVRTQFPGSPGDALLAMALAPDGRVVAAGVCRIRPWRVAVARYLPDGSLDATFGNGGLVTTPSARTTFVTSALVQADGRVVVAAIESGAVGIVLRYRADGTLDPTLGQGGRLELSSSYYGAFPRRLTVPEPGRLVLAGHNGRADFLLTGLAVTTPVELQSFTAD